MNDWKPKRRGGRRVTLLAMAMAIVVALALMDEVAGLTSITLLIKTGTNNNGCDNTSDCDTTCTTDSFMYVMDPTTTSAYTTSFSLSERTDSSSPSWYQTVNTYVVNTFSGSVDVYLSCYDDDGFRGKEGPWTNRVTFNNLVASNRGNIINSVSFGSLGPYYTDFFFDITIKCDPFYYGPLCQEYCKVGVPAACTSCNSDTGFCVCTTGFAGKDCNVCAANYYPNSGGCKYCLANQNGCYSCSSTGDKICCSGYQGTNCDIPPTCPGFPTAPANTFRNTSACSCGAVNCTCQYACVSGYAGTPATVVCQQDTLTWSPLSISCSDADECALGTHACNQTCSNTIGDYTCLCNSGYNKNGDGRGSTGCTNINECSLSGQGGCQQVCIDTPGSYICSCNSGYQLNLDSTTCRNINECTEGGNNCSPHANCTDTLGSFSCSCNSGFSGNGVTCNDVDECLQTPYPCHPDAVCTNTNGSYTCACNVGFLGNGLVCNPSGTVSFSASSITVNTAEGPGDTTVTLTITSFPVRDDCYVSYSVGGTATNGVDYYIATNAPILLTQAAPTVVISVVILDDSVAENLETIIVTLTSPLRLALASTNTVATIRIDPSDNRNGNVRFVASSLDMRVGIAAGTYNLTIERYDYTSLSAPVALTIQGFNPSAQTFNAVIPSNNVSVSLPVPLPFSSVPSLDTLYNFTITSAVCQGGCAAGVNPFVGFQKTSLVTVNAHDDPYGLFAINQTSASLEEGAAATFAVARLKGTVGTVSVRVRTVTLSSTETGGLVAAGGSDYVSFNTLLVFAESETVKLFSVSVVDDTTPEVAEMFGVSLSIESGSGRADPAASLLKITIPENDYARGVLSLLPVASCYDETGSPSRVVTVQVKRALGTFGSISFQWVGLGGKFNNSTLPAANTATAGQDFTPASVQTATIAEGVDSATLSITIINDNIPELQEYFYVSILNASTGVVVNTTNNFVDLCITMNDSPFGEVGFAPLATSIGPNNERRVLFTEGSSASFTVNRYFGTFGNISATVSLVHETTSNADFVSFVASKTVLFAPGESSAVVSWAINATDGDESAEFFYVLLAADGAVAGLREAATLRTTAPADANISCAIDTNNAQYGTVRFAQSVYTALEDDMRVVLSVVRVASNPTDVNCSVVTTPGTASGDDFDASNENNKLFIPSTQNATNISITITNDNLPELDETFSVSLVNVSGGAVLSFASIASVTILMNDDAKGVFGFAANTNGTSPGVFTFKESYGAARFVVQRTVSQLTNVTVKCALVTTLSGYPALTSLPALDYPFASLDADVNMTGIESVGSNVFLLSFADGQASANFSIPIINDAVGETTEKLYLVLLEPSGGSRLGNLSAVALVIEDDDFVPSAGSSSPALAAGAGAGGAIVLIALVIVAALVLRRRRKSKSTMSELNTVPMSTVSLNGAQPSRNSSLYDNASMAKKSSFSVAVSSSLYTTANELASEGPSTPPAVNRSTKGDVYASLPSSATTSIYGGSTYSTATYMSTTGNSLYGASLYSSGSIKANSPYESIDRDSSPSIAKITAGNMGEYESLTPSDAALSSNGQPGLPPRLPARAPGSPPALPARTNAAAPPVPRRTDTVSPLYAAVHKDRGELELVKQLGSGAFGEVYLGIAPLPWFGSQASIPQSLVVPNRNTYANATAAPFVKVAVKVLKQGVEEKARRDFIAEVECMRQFNHRNIVSFVAMFKDTEPWMAVLEFVPYGDLRNLLAVCTEYGVRPSFYEQLFMLFQIASGMDYLVSKKFIHRDLAARNCLVGTGLVVKVADFGLSHQLAGDKDYYKVQTSGKLPLKWMAPEFILFRKSSHASDVWSFGVLMWEVFTSGAVPYDDMQPAQVVSFLEAGKRLSKPADVTDPDIFESITMQCWQGDPALRPTFADLVEAFAGRMSSQVNALPVRDLGELVLQIVARQAAAR